MDKTRVALYPGTFDPVTNGHMDIIVRAAGVCDRLIVAVAANSGKGPLFALGERVEILREEIAGLDPALSARIEVQPFRTLLMRFAEAVGAHVIVRGLRAVSDFEYEFQMAAMNRRMNPNVETVFLMASETNQFISSRFVKEIARLGGEVSHFVSPRVASRIKLTQSRSAGAPPAPGSDGPPPTIPVPAARTPL